MLINKIIIRISNNRFWIIDYHLIGVVVFIPLTIYGSITLRKKVQSYKKKYQEGKKAKIQTRDNMIMIK